MESFAARIDLDAARRTSGDGYYYLKGRHRCVCILLSCPTRATPADRPRLTYYIPPSRDPR
ncbi:MAG: hypothetical protein ACLR4Z_17025 [Butyricicoccaceae bacterium]